MNLPELDAAVRVPAENAVYASRSSDLLTFASERREEMYAGSLSGVFRAAYERGYRSASCTRTISESWQRQRCVSCTCPCRMVLSERETEHLVRFVERRGTLVSEACPGLYRPDGLLDQEGTGA